MINLAGVPDCDTTIATELHRARIDIVHHDSVAASEVTYRITGKLGRFTFERAWRYWIVTGEVPLDVAVRLYEDPVGATDIRIAGHADCQPPESPWVRYIGKSGKRLRPLTCKGAPANRPADLDAFMAKVYENYDSQTEHVDSPETEAVKAYVPYYHIDTEVGLRVFADAVRDLP